MPPNFVKLNPYFSRIAALAVIALTIRVQADQNPGNAPHPKEDPGFFNRASNDVGGFFRRLFGTDERTQQQPAPAPPPSTRKSRSSGPRYNLDQAPGELHSSPTDTTRVNSPPPAPTTSKELKEAPGNSPKSKLPATSTGRGTTLIEDPPKPKPKPPKSPAADSSPTTVATETTPRPKPEPAPRPRMKKPVEETADRSAGPGSVLYSNSGAPNSKQPEPPDKVQTETTPPPPKAPTESGNVLTGTKTGKSGRVKSPYAPYSELDVTGLPSGSLALDPTTQKVFRIP